MPYLISDKQSDCQGWATVKEESDGSYTTIGCHDNKQDAIDQMVAVSIEEDIEPGGEVATRALPDNYRPALADDVPEGRACGNCFFYNEAKQNEEGTKAWCELWEDFVDGGYYCNKWQADEASRQVDLTVPQFIRDNAERGLKYVREGFGGDGLTDTAKREAREMAAGRITENKVRKMAPWFARHKVDGQAPKNKDSSNPQYPGAGLVAWLIWGGDSNFSDRAQNWAQRKIDALDLQKRHAAHDQLSHGRKGLSNYQNLKDEQSAYNNSLSSAEKQSIEDYKDRSFISINQGLRENKPLSPKDSQTSANLDKSIANAPTFTETKVLARGIDGEAKEKLFANAKNGDIISDSGFLSTTADEKVAANFTTQDGARLTIIAPVGSRGLVMGERPDKIIQSEGEVLFGRNTKYRVLDINKGKSQITVEVIP